MDTFIVGRHNGKIHSTLIPKVWLSGCDYKFWRFLCWVLLDLYVHQRRQSSKPRTMPFSVSQQDRTTLSLFMTSGSICGLGPDLVGIHSISLAARCRLQHATTLRRGQEKVTEARGHNCTPLFCFYSLGNKSSFSFHVLSHGECI